MNITDKGEEVTSFETVDIEPYHYFALVRSKPPSAWMIQYSFPMTDKQALINVLNHNTAYHEQSEARIMKVRLPIGQ